MQRYSRIAVSVYSYNYCGVTQHSACIHIHVPMYLHDNELTILIMYMCCIFRLLLYKRLKSPLILLRKTRRKELIL